jgi:uroporphyrinogen-III decarboxylase
MGHAGYAVEGRDFDNDIRSPFNTPEEVLAFDPWEQFGRIDHGAAVRMFNDHYRRRQEANPDMVAMTGTYVTLFSGLIALFGWDLLLLAGGLDPEGLGQAANRYARWMQQYYDALAESETKVVYLHDDLVWTAGPVFRPDGYREYIFPNIKRYWAPLNDAGKKVMFVCDGNYGEFLDDIAGCGNSGFWFESFTDLETVAERFGRSHFIVGNADTRILLRNRKPEIRAEVERCLAVGTRLSGYFLAVSNHIPPNTPVEAALCYDEVYRELRDR